MVERRTKVKRGTVVYRRGGFQVLPLVVGYVVCSEGGETVYPTVGKALPLHEAIETCDEIALEEDGVAA